MSGSNPQPNIDKAIWLGFDSHLSTLITVEVLLAAVAQLHLH